MAGKRDYGQFCGLAAAMNVLGERWTILIIRELLIGPARFNELAENLPGIGPNLLTERLRSLLEAEVIEQSQVAWDGRAKLYQLTERGKELREPVLALAHWGMSLLDEEDRNGAVRAEWGFLAVQSMIEKAEIPDVDETYQFEVGDEQFSIEVRGGSVNFHRDGVENPDLILECDADTFVRVGARLLTPFEAIATGAVRIKGEPERIHRCSRMLGLT